MIWTDFPQFLFILCTMWCERMIDNRLYGWISWPSSSLHIKQQGTVSNKQAQTDRLRVCSLLSMAESRLVEDRPESSSKETLKNIILSELQEGKSHLKGINIGITFIRCKCRFYDNSLFWKIKWFTECLRELLYM